MDIQNGWQTLLDSWIVARDTTGELRSESRRFGCDCSDCIGWFYVDHNCGLSMIIHTFCAHRGRIIEAKASPWKEQIMIVIRSDVLEKLKVSPLSKSQRDAVGLPEVFSEALAAYRMPELEPIRKLEWLNPLRAPGYPDDIKVIIGSPEKKQEVVWARMERKLDANMFECTLLNQPQDDFGVEKGNRVAVRLKKVKGGVISMCVGKV